MCKYCRIQLKWLLLISAESCRLNVRSNALLTYALNTGSGCFQAAVVRTRYDVDRIVQVIWMWRPTKRKPLKSVRAEAPHNTNQPNNYTGQSTRVVPKVMSNNFLYSNMLYY